MSDPRDRPEPSPPSPRRPTDLGHGSATPPIRAAVAGQLKSLFAELTSGPMPDHLLALVDQLEAAQDAAGERPRRANGETRRG